MCAPEPDRACASYQRGARDGVAVHHPCPSVPRVDGGAYPASPRKQRSSPSRPGADPEREVAPHPLAQCFGNGSSGRSRATSPASARPRVPIELEVARIERAAWRRTAGPIARDARPSASASRGEHVLFPKHPLNRDAGVAFRDADLRTLAARFTSSRTLVVWDGRRIALRREARDRPSPHGRVSAGEDEAARGGATRRCCSPSTCARSTRGSASIRSWSLLVGVDRRLGAGLRDGPPGARSRAALRRALLPARVQHPVRRPRDRGSRRRVVRRLLGRGYAEPVGRAKAKLLARYGLQYQTPNPQNILVQLDATPAPDRHDRAARPGRHGLRDRLGGRLRRAWTRLTAVLAPETANSFWAFEQAPESPADPATLDGLVRATRSRVPRRAAPPARPARRATRSRRSRSCSRARSLGAVSAPTDTVRLTPLRRSGLAERMVRPGARRGSAPRASARARAGGPATWR